MTYMSDRPGRRSVRLRSYDYAQTGAYFVTICTHIRELLFYDSQICEILQNQWAISSEMRAEVCLDAFVVMPNHVHGVVWITESTGVPNVGAQGLAPLQRAPNVMPRSLGAFVRGFKSAVTREVNALRKTPGIPVWQRNYYEHVIRGEEELERRRQYIADNPAKWDEDENNPANFPPVTRSRRHR